jgi:hypothetical protein
MIAVMAAESYTPVGGSRALADRQREQRQFDVAGAAMSAAARNSPRLIESAFCWMRRRDSKLSHHSGGRWGICRRRSKVFAQQENRGLSVRIQVQCYRTGVGENADTSS